MRSVRTGAIICMVLMGTAVCPLQANPVDIVEMEHDGFGAKGVITIWGGGHSGLSVYGGAYMFEKTGGAGEGELWPDGPIGGFCMDLAQWLGSSSLTYEVLKPEEGPRPTTFLGGPMGEDKADYLRELWGRFFDPSWVGGGSFTSEQNNQAEAFAAAVWEIIYEDLPASASAWDVSSDGSAGDLGFRATNLDSATANAWLHALDGTGPKANLRGLSNNCKQDFLVEVPEPATVALLGLGTLILFYRRRG